MGVGSLEATVRFGFPRLIVFHRFDDRQCDQVWLCVKASIALGWLGKMSEAPAPSDDSPATHVALPPWVAVAAFVIAIYTLAVSCLVLGGIYEVHINELSSLKSVGIAIPQDASSFADVRLALLTAFGASLGACLLSFSGLFNHAVLNADFSPRFIGSYVIAPLAIMFLGLAAYALVRAGLLVFGNVSNLENIASVNELSYLAFGILVGFSWNRVLGRIADIASDIFSGGRTHISLRRADN